MTEERVKVSICPECNHVEGMHVQVLTFDPGTLSGEFAHSACECGCGYYTRERPAEPAAVSGQPPTPHEVIVQVMGNTFGSGDEYAADILDALTAAGYVLIHLPESEDIPPEYNDTPKVQCLGVWENSGGLTAWSDGLITDEVGSEFSAADARAFAAALLAAAAAAADGTGDK